MIEMMAQSASLAWPQRIEQLVAVNFKRLFMPASFLQSTNGSTIFAAMEQVDANSSVPALLSLLSHVMIVVYFVGSDLAGANGRAKMEIARQFKENNQMAKLLDSQGVAILIVGQCAAHILQREIEASMLRTKELVSKMFAVAWSCSLPGTFAKVAITLKKIVAADLEIGFFPRVIAAT